MAVLSQKPRTASCGGHGDRLWRIGGINWRDGSKSKRQGVFVGDFLEAIKIGDRAVIKNTDIFSFKLLGSVREHFSHFGKPGLLVVARVKILAEKMSVPLFVAQIETKIKDFIEPHINSSPLSRAFEIQGNLLNRLT